MRVDSLKGQMGAYEFEHAVLGFVNRNRCICPPVCTRLGGYVIVLRLEIGVQKMFRLFISKYKRDAEMKLRKRNLHVIFPGTQKRDGDDRIFMLSF